MNMKRAAVVLCVFVVFLFAPFSLARKVVRSAAQPNKEASTDKEALSSAGIQQPFDKTLPSREDHLVTDLPGVPFGYTTKMYAGLLSVYEDEYKNNGALFYWLYESQLNPSDSPMIIWLNGGPGCSSLEGMFLENGPLRPNPDGRTLREHPHAWNSKANLLYIDQPVGTGLSLVDGDNFAANQTVVNAHFAAFMDRFIKVFPDYRTRPIYIAGESYAGAYIPNFSVLMRQAPLNLNVEGVMIGNGWTDPLRQTEIFPEFALNAGLIGRHQVPVIQNLVNECLHSTKNGFYGDKACDGAIDGICNLTGIEQTGIVNMYDIRRYDSSAGGDWPTVNSGELQYLNLPDVRAALHATASSLQWTECSDPVFNILYGVDNMRSSLHLVEQLLAEKVQVLIYSGQFDLVCNHFGTEYYLNQLKWTDLTKWQRADRTVWVVNGNTAGYVQAYGDLTFALVLGGSHMVPLDKPAESLDMILRFMHGWSFSDVSVQVIDPDSTPREQFFAEIKSTSITSASFTFLIFFASIAIMVGVFFRTLSKRRDYISLPDPTSPKSLSSSPSSSSSSSSVDSWYSALRSIPSLLGRRKHYQYRHISPPSKQYFEEPTYYH